MISATYIELNRQLHQTKRTYGCSGHFHKDKVIELVNVLGTHDVLDYGCGKGTLGNAMPFDIREYDPAVDNKEAPPDPADIVVCTDVLEHIEPDQLDAVLEHLVQLTKRAGFFTIATRKAKKKLADGRNAHLIVESPAWWRERLEGRFTIASFKADGGKGEIHVTVTPLEA